MSAVACPRCHTPSVTEPEMGVAQCASCGEVFEVSGAALPAFDGANPPDGVEVRREGEVLELTLPWSADLTYAGHIVQFTFPLGIGAVLLAALVRYPEVLLSPTDLVQLVGVSGLLVGAPLYAAVCYVVNASTVRIGPDGVSVTHGPLPTHVGAVSISAARLQDLQARTVMVRAGRSGHVARYALQGRHGTLLTKWREETVQYVLGAIRAARMPR